MKRLFKIISFPLGCLRHRAFFFLIDFIRNYYEVTLADIITETGVGVILERQP